MTITCFEPLIKICKPSLKNNYSQAKNKLKELKLDIHILGAKQIKELALTASLGANKKTLETAKSKLV